MTTTKHNPKLEERLDLYRDKSITYRNRWLKEHRNLAHYQQDLAHADNEAKQTIKEDLLARLPKEANFPETMKYVKLVERASQNNQYDDMYEFGYKQAIQDVTEAIRTYCGEEKQDD